MFELKAVVHSTKIQNQFQRLARKLSGLANIKVVVGYEADYALTVHENIAMAGRGKPRRSGVGNYWDPQGRGQAKFLEQPAREYKKQIAAHIRIVTKSTKSLEAGMLSGGKMLLGLSQNLVPVEYGELKKSGFYRLENIGG